MSEYVVHFKKLDKTRISLGKTLGLRMGRASQNALASRVTTLLHFRPRSVTTSGGVDPLRARGIAYASPFPKHRTDAAKGATETRLGRDLHLGFASSDLRFQTQE